MKINDIIRKLKLFFIKLAKEKSSIHEISFGFAVGTFISVFPTFGLGMILVVILSKLLKFNLVSGLSASIISNPFTSPFFMVLSFKIGSFFLDTKVKFDLNKWKENLSDTGLIILVGSLLVSTILSIAAYFISKYIITKIRNRRNRKKSEHQ